MPASHPGKRPAARRPAPCGDPVTYQIARPAGRQWTESASAGGVVVLRSKWQARRVAFPHLRTRGRVRSRPSAARPCVNSRPRRVMRRSDRYSTEGWQRGWPVRDMSRPDRGSGPGKIVSGGGSLTLAGTQVPLWDQLSSAVGNISSIRGELIFGGASRCKRSCGCRRRRHRQSAFVEHARVSARRDTASAGPRYPVIRLW
jgi:hypothetical protein